MGRNAYCMRFRPVPSEGESFMASKQKILIVDDDTNIAELISLYLTKECYETMIVNDGIVRLVDDKIRVLDTFSCGRGHRDRA